MDKLLIPSYLDIAKSLQIKEDDVIYLAVDIKNLSKVCKNHGEHFDAYSFVKSFQQILTEGTLIVPAFTEYLEAGMTFDPDKNDPDTGAFSSFVWQMKDFERTLDPIHSVLVWGNRSEELLSYSHTNAYGDQSVFGFLKKHRAKAIIIDYPLQDSFPFVHYVEQSIGIRYRRMSHRQYLISVDGTEKEINYHYFRKKGWVLNDFYELQGSMSQEGVKSNLYFDDVKIQKIEFDKAFDFIKKYIKSGKRVYQIDLIYFVKRLVTKPFRLLKRRK